MTVADTNTTQDSPDSSDPPEYMLTTVDNPYDPWTQWDEWFAWDQAAGYHTPGLLARIARTSDDLPEGDQLQIIQEAIDEIVRENVLGVLRKVKEGDVLLPKQG
jgi:hypothetical protein